VSVNLDTAQAVAETAMADEAREHQVLKAAHAAAVKQLGEWETKGAELKRHREEAEERQKGTYRDVVVLQVRRRTFLFSYSRLDRWTVK
jgi:hypothetical protein